MFLRDHISTQENLTESQLNKLKHNFAHFKSETKRRWTKSHKKEKAFLKNNHLWMEGIFEIPVTPINRQGRPRKSFSESSERTKRRKTEEIRSNVEDGMKNDEGWKEEKYAEETAWLYVKLYPWHPMTPTLHKVLVHGSDILKNALLPIGQLSEEAAEARNKHFRAYRQDYSRKFSREFCNRDILNRLLLSSDPYFNASSVIKQNKKSSFLPETLNMIVSATPNPADPL